MSGAEPEMLSWCCDAPVRVASMLTLGGIGTGTVCTKCGKYALPRKVWNGLPPPGSFEQQPGEKSEMHRR